jgi:hypothetical protein
LSKKIYKLIHCGQFDQTYHLRETSQIFVITGHKSLNSSAVYHRVSDQEKFEMKNGRCSKHASVASSNTNSNVEIFRYINFK